jgi:imidazolonepropionase-like amidohydrolase
MLKAMGATIAIGTDSLASARSLSMVENMRMLGEMCDAPLCEILTWATYNGAKALGLEQSMGSIERGKSPGLVVVEGADLQSLRLTPETTTRRVV